MSLTRYLLIVWLLSLGGLLILGVAGNGRQGLAGMIAWGPFIALANTFINVWPWARRVPLEKRTSFRAYRWTNVFMAVWFVAVAAIVIWRIVEAIIR